MAYFGLLYPVAGCRGEAHYGVSTALDFVHQRKKSEDEARMEREQLYEELHGEIRSSGAEKILISSENFVLHHDVSAVKNFFYPYEVFVIVYLRRHDTWWESAYAQAVKMVTNPPWQRGFEAYLKFQKEKNPKYGNYRILVDRWASVFGREKIIVRPYEMSQNQPNLLTDFMNAIGMENAALMLKPENERLNESVPFQALNLLEFYQRIDVDPATRERLLKHALALSIKNGRGHIADPASRRNLIEENLADYAYIARTYMGRSDGKLFTEPVPDVNSRWAPQKRLSYLRVIEETAKALQ